MYATKEAIILKEHDKEVECTLFYMDMRCYGKGFDAYFRRAVEQGVRYVNCRISYLEEDPETKDILLRYRNLEGEPAILDERFSLVVLSVGLQPPRKISELARILDIELNEQGFCKTDELHPLETNKPGIYVCGSFMEPKDIPDCVIQASGAAAKVGALLAEVRGEKAQKKIYPEEKEVSPLEEPRVGVFVCSCGSNIAGVIRVDEVVEFVKRLPHVVHVENTIYTCSADSLKLIQQRIEEHKLNRLVVASCSPRTHEPLFRETMQEAGLNPYLFEMANIRDQCSWVHMAEKEKATEKAKRLVSMAVAAARHLQPLRRKERPLIRKALVLGGGLAGMTSALSLAEQGFFVSLVEKEEQLGGLALRIHSGFGEKRPKEYVEELRKKVENHTLIEVITDHEVIDHEGAIGNFKTKIRERKGLRQRIIEHGVTIVATGAKEYRGEAYFLGKSERVITQLDLEGCLAQGESFLKGVREVVMIQCVGPWDENAAVPFYCSRICCATAVKNALRLKELKPEVKIYILYKDMRTYGFKEHYYTDARRKGVVFFRIVDTNKPKVTIENGQISLEIYDPVVKSYFSLKPDYLVLSEAIVPTEDTHTLANIFKLPRSAEGFFLEAHMKLRPVDFASDGFFLCGFAHYPKTMDETIAQAEAAAARAAGILAKEYLLTGPVVAVVNKEKCAACLTCVRVCPFGVPLINDQGEAQIDEALCKGCGTCVAECPARAIDLLNVLHGQLQAKLVNAFL